MSGQGKTTKLREFIVNSRRAMCFDPLGVLYPGIALDGRKQLEQWIDRNGNNDRFKIIYRPMVDEANYQAMQRESEYFCCIARKLENVDCYFDELDTFARADDNPNELYALLNWGRRHNVSISGTVRRPQVKVPKEWFSETTDFYIFKTDDPLDCSLISRKTKISADEFGKLEPFEYWAKLPGICEKSKIISPY
jgi:hypothetical protein